MIPITDFASLGEQEYEQNRAHRGERHRRHQKADAIDMHERLFRYIWRHTRPQQMWILTIVVLSMPIYFLSLDLPKRIVNGPIQGNGFTTAETTQTFLGFSIPLPAFLGGGITFDGFDLDRMSMLVALSLTFLALVCINGLFKFYINTYKGRLGERMLRRLRFELVDRVLRFPIGHFRRVRAPEVATMVKDEVEPLGGFIGDAFVSPVFLGGQALTAMIFIVVQNVWLGLIAGSIVLIQAIVIPKLRRRLLELGKQRQLTARELAGRVGEIVDSIADVRTNDTSNYERAGISNRLGRIFFIRYEFYQRKFFIKFLNNFLAQVTPFLFYLVGGAFAISGQLDIGQLVAVIAAYKDLPSPIKELIDWDQRRLDVEIKYDQVMEQFAPDGMIDPARQTRPEGPVAPVTEPITVEAVTMLDDTGATLVENASFEISPGRHIATIGEVNSGAEAIADALARLQPTSAGRILVAGTPIDEVPEALTGQRFAYVGSEPTLLNVSLRENLIYALKHAPGHAVGNDSARGDADDLSDLTALQVDEARASGNVPPLADRDWIDYAGAGVADAQALNARIAEVLRTVGLENDVVDLGLRSRLDPETHGHISDRVLEAREAVRKIVSAPEYRDLIDVFDPEQFNPQLSIAGNLVFGRARKPDWATDTLAENAFVRKTLHDAELDGPLFKLGRRIAETMIELFADLQPGNPFLEQMSFITVDELPVYRQLLTKDGHDAMETASEPAVTAFLRLAMAYIEPQHRLGLLNDALRARLLRIRHQISRTLPNEDPRAVWFYAPDEFNPGATLRDNILFGRAAHGIANGEKTLRNIFKSILNRLEMNDVVFEAGLEFEVGSNGRRLTSSQRQRVGLARALMKRPDLLIVNRGLSALSARSQTRVLQRVLASVDGAKEGDEANETRAAFATFWVLMNARNAEHFDEVLVFENARLVERGAPADLAQGDSRYASLID
ncbi:MAG: ABC transporter transmembrane domain-containing protein [Pseudomonadota bacterium]